MRHHGRASGGERPARKARAVALGHEHGISSHVGNDVPLALIRGLARRDDVHDQPPDAAVGRERDLGVTLMHAREPVHLLARHRVASAHHALDRHRVLAEAGDEPVAFRGLASAACGQGETGEDQSLHGDSSCGSVCSTF